MRLTVNSPQSTVGSSRPAINRQRSAIKILILSHRFYPDVGGIETNSEILAAAFQEFGADVRVVTWTKNDNDKQFSYPVIRNPGLKALFTEHRRADVVFENNPSLRLSWPNVFIRRPLVIAVNTWVNRRKGNKGTKDQLKNLWFKRASSVIAVSDAIRKKEWPDAVVIENPYNDRLFHQSPQMERKIPFIFLGRLVSDKGADQAIQAISVLAGKNVLDKNQLQLTVTGDGPERKNLLQLREQLGLEGAVHFTGILKGENLVDCLNRHRFIIVPSKWEEPYGNVVLEAMACGCIPIASDGGGMPEAVGNAGLIFKRNSMDALVAALQTTLNGSAIKEKFGREAAGHLAKHAVNVVAEKYFRILKDAAGQR